MKKNPGKSSLCADASLTLTAFVGRSFPIQIDNRQAVRSRRFYGKKCEAAVCDFQPRVNFSYLGGMSPPPGSSSLTASGCFYYLPHTACATGGITCEHVTCNRGRTRKDAEKWGGGEGCRRRGKNYEASKETMNKRRRSHPRRP